ncbi:MAG: chemotaxis protein CheW [Bacillota bacterium]|nr:chemotaxis protein CheW [Bacillota bacterium]MDW7683032.1 chemotaxis protein CheW [Bacillota bacterium]
MVRQELHNGTGEELYVVFKLAQEEFGAKVCHVREVIKLPDITKIPQSKDFVEGMINIRGMVIPVVNLKQRLGLGCDIKPSSKILIMELGESNIGLIVDHVDEVLRVQNEHVKHPPRLACACDNRYIDGIVYHNEEMVILLNLSLIFRESEKEELLLLAKRE